MVASRPYAGCRFAYVDCIETVPQYGRRYEFIGTDVPVPAVQMLVYGGIIMNWFRRVFFGGRVPSSRNKVIEAEGIARNRAYPATSGSYLLLQVIGQTLSGAGKPSGLIE